MKRIISLLLCCMLVFTLCQSAFAEGNTITWTGAAGDGLWHTASNWSPGKVPGPGDTAVIPVSETAEPKTVMITDDTTVTLDCSGKVEVAAYAHLYLEGTSYLKSEEGKLDGGGNITIKEDGELWWSGGLIDGNGLLTLEENASLVIDTSSEVYPGVDLARSMVNNGQVTVNDGELYLYGNINGTGTFEISDGAYLSFDEGDYDIGGDFVNCGEVSIWDDASVKFSADYRQEDTGSLALKVWGTDPSEYCKLNVTGEAYLDGKLEIDFLYYAPQLGDSFEILTCDVRVGEFSSIVGGDEGIVLMPTYTDTGLTLTVSDGSAPGEYVCAILNEDGTYTKYTALDDALEAVQEGETRTILLLKDIEYASAIIIKNKHITFDLNGYTLNVVNEEAELDTIEATSGLYVEGNATVELEDEGEFNVTGSRYGVFAECDIEQGEKPLVTVTSATGIGRYGVAAQGTKVTVHRDVISYGSDFEDEWAGVLADNGGEVIIGGSITAEGSANTGVYACDGGCVTVKGDVSVSDGEDDDGTGIYLDCSADEDESVVIIDGIIEADKYIVFYVFDGSVEETIEFDFQQGCFDPGVREDYRYYTADDESFVYVAMFDGGSGTGEDPFLVGDGTHLFNVREYLSDGKYFRQTAGIDLNRHFGEDKGGWDPIGHIELPFIGFYDGGNHTISNLYIYNSYFHNGDYTGLFAYIGENSEIRSVGLTNAYVVGEKNTGALAGGSAGTVINSYATGTVSVETFGVGGLIGSNEGIISNCYFEGEVDGGSGTGGLVGYNETGADVTGCHAVATVTSKGEYGAGGLVGNNSGSVTGSYAICNVRGDNGVGGLVGASLGSTLGSIHGSYAIGVVRGHDLVGGLVGENEDLIDECFANVTVTGTEEEGYTFLYFGGLAGRNGGEIKDSYAWGSVSAEKYVGGLVGYNFNSITNSYSTGAVSGGSDVGGLVGYGESYSTVTNSYWDIETSNRTSSSGGTGKSTAEMKLRETYEEWNFDTIWDINSSYNNGYPFLRWQVLVITVPTAPQYFTATPGDGEVTLSWTAPEDDGGGVISRYEVSSDNGVNWTNAGLVTTYTFTGLTNGTEYTFKVRAVNSAGHGEGATVKATPTAPPVTKYTVTVTNGTGSGEYPVGATVSISVYSVPDGYQFKEWQVISGDVTLENTKAPSTSFTMPANDVEVAAIYEDIPVATYTVTVNGSYAATTGAGSYAQGDTVTISTGSRANYSFSGWTSPDDVTFANPNSVTTTFIMPAKNVTVTANWTYTGSDDGGDDKDDDNTGGSGTSTPSTPKSTPSPTYNANVKTEQGTEMTVPVTVDKDTGAASVDVDSDKLAQGGVNITMPSIPDVDAYSVSIPVQDLSMVDAQDAFSFNTETGSATVPSNMLTGTTVPEGDKAQITIGRGDKSSLPEDVRDAIGDRPLVQLTLTIDGNQTEWNNPDAPVTVTIPYTPTAEELENPESIVVWYIDGSGNVISVPNGRYDPVTGTVTFTTTHFSYYAVSYKYVSFRDVAKDAWYAKAVSFIAARDITQGTGSGRFSPEAKLTRAQFVVMMMRAYDIAPDENPEDNFADAGNTWYTGYLAAAKRLGISAGVGNNMFAPDRDITRQEMFTLLYNALRVIGQLPEGDSGRSLSDFGDIDDIASWAKEAMKLLVETGTISGIGNRLSPKDTTTRAQMAQVLYNQLAK